MADCSKLTPPALMNKALMAHWQPVNREMLCAIVAFFFTFWCFKRRLLSICGSAGKVWFAAIQCYLAANNDNQRKRQIRLCVDDSAEAATAIARCECDRSRRRSVWRLLHSWMRRPPHRSQPPHHGVTRWWYYRGVWSRSEHYPVLVVVSVTLDASSAHALRSNVSYRVHCFAVPLCSR